MRQLVERERGPSIGDDVASCCCWLLVRNSCRPLAAMTVVARLAALLQNMPSSL